MTSLLLHGLTTGACPAPDAPPHRRLRAGGLVALCTPFTRSLAHEDDAIAGALAHDALLAAEAAGADVLPVRFGTAFSSAAAVADHVAAHAPAYRAALSRIAGAREYALRICLSRADAAAADGAAPAARADHSGREFLARRRRARDSRLAATARRTAEIERIVRAVAVNARATMNGAPPRDGRLLDLALLVPRSDDASLPARVAAAAPEAAEAGLTLSLAGPWPAYSFARVEEPAHA